MSLPTTFIDLQTAYGKPLGSFVNLIGVVVDILPPSLIHTGQHIFTFKLLDQQTRDSIDHTNGLPVRFFRPDVGSLPKVRSIGDVVLLRSVKMHTYAGQQIALASYQTSVLVFPVAAIPDPAYSIAFSGTRRLQCHGVERDVESLSLPQQAYVIHLKAELKSTVGQIPKITTPETAKKQVKPSLPPPRPIEKEGMVTSLPTSALVERKRVAPTLPPSAPSMKRARHSAYFGAKFKLVSDLRHRDFADVCVQVVKKFTNSFGSCEIYVTDYTENHDMYYYAPPEEAGQVGSRDGDTYGYSSGPPKRTFPGPYGWLVLKVNVKDPHATFINTNISEGDMVVLRNLKLKIANEGARLEGDMWPDSVNPDKIQIRKLPNPDLLEIEELNTRKDRYWAGRKALMPAEQADDLPRKLTKKEKKKKEKKEEKKGRRQLKEATAATEESADEDVMTRSDLNKHIRCGHHEVPTTSIRDILDFDNVRHTNVLPDGRSYVMPFINAKYRAQVRVVDYEPKALEEFAVASSADEDAEMSPIDTAYSASPKLEWFFSLTLEEARAAQPNPERIEVHLQHEDAQFLLGDLNDPADLRANPLLLARLRLKLATLWGNLEEKSSAETLSNRAFECCIAEHGLEMDDDDPEKAQSRFGWKKLYRMFQTTIL